MKQTMALVDFMANTGTSLIEAIGLIDQLHEMEREDKNLDEISDGFFSAYLREPLKRVSGMELAASYSRYKTRVKSEMSREYDARYKARKRRDESEEEAREKRDESEIKARKKSRQETERSDSSSPSSPTPPISSLSLEERERNIK